MLPYLHFFHPTRLFGTQEYVVSVKSMVKILSIFLAFLENMKFS